MAVYSKRAYAVDRKGRLEKRKLTHFLSLPMATDQIKSRYGEWRNQILQKEYPGILPKLFLRPEILHITLLMLPLETEAQVEQARRAV